MRYFQSLSLFILIFLTACGGGGSSSGDQGRQSAVQLAELILPPFVPFSKSKAYQPNSPYANSLVGCIATQENSGSCSLQTLPLIGMETENPQIADIMARVVVSHDWMGARFEQALQVMPADILTLLKGVTAVVIDSEVRPAYYTNVTGAIYLDPAYLWLTNGEKNSISKKQDFRAGFGSALSFVDLSRYSKDGEPAYQFYPLDGTEERELDDIVYPLASLLFHELAHANDFFPPSQIDLLDANQSVLSASAQIGQNRISVKLAQSDPLQSQIMFGLAGVMFKGDTATAAQAAMTAAQVGEEFEGDAASDNYAYTSIYEDVAMLFEETMMKRHFDIDRELAFTSAPDGSTNCEDYIVGWGNKNRVGNNDTRFRAQFVTGEMLPGSELSLFFQNLPYPEEMQTGLSWCSEDLFPNSGSEKSQAADSEKSGKKHSRQIDPSDWLRPM